ncbi:cobalamin-independent methionine synthase II family protein [Halobellus rufus]|uniref:cobalamin-independent methionine synthase II family protein n=1 Tax=Halobellus rufus TaxID=1448860 RepID=UPI0006794D9A|nr:cobalamin-independent methionine synthase II family protein [Halobellus rufus]
MSSPAIRTTHVGSLPRSDRLRSLLTADEVDDEEFDSAVDESIREVVRRQSAAGIDVANDGEQSRIAYSVDVTNRLSGFGEGTVEREWPADLDDFPEYGEELLGASENIGGPVARGPIEYVGEEALERDLARFDEAVAAEGVEFPARFHTAPSPGAVLRFTETEYHDSDEAYLFDLADALATEYELIAETGAVLQIDAPDLLAGFTLTYKDDSVDDFRERVRTHVEALNEAVSAVPSEQIRLHGCWGNYEGPHHHDVALDAVIDAFYEADVGGLVVEGANPRHQHEYRTFEEHPLPDGWRLIPGVVDVKTNVVEHPEVVADRIERFANAVGDPERIVAGADCGFETVVEGANAVHPSIAWKKLEALREGADLAAERLF